MRQANLIKQWYDLYIGEITNCSVGNSKERVIKDFHFNCDPSYPKHIHVSFEGVKGRQIFNGKAHFENYFHMHSIQSKNESSHVYEIKLYNPSNKNELLKDRLPIFYENEFESMVEYLKKHGIEGKVLEYDTKEYNKYVSENILDAQYFHVNMIKPLRKLEATELY